MKLDQFLRRTCEQFPQNTAVIDQDSQINYADLGAATARFAESLKQLPIAPGSRIGLLMENSIDYVISFFAVIEAGFVVVPLDTSANGETLRFIIADCGIKALITQSRYRRQLKVIFDNETNLKFLFCDSQLNFAEGKVQSLIFGTRMALADVNVSSSQKAEAVDRIVMTRGAKEHELAAIFYTSGSTGTPKGVMLSHLNLMSNTTATIEYLRLTEIDRTLVILPFYYIYGNSLLLTNVACGACLVIDNRFLYPETILNTLEEHQCTGLSGVPSNFMILLGKSTLTSRKLPHLRYFTQAGGAMAPDIVRILADAFPTKDIYIMYGQTEAAPRVTYLPPSRLAEKLGSIGIPLTGITVTISDDQHKEVPAGETGELVVSGDNVMMGYWNQPEEQREVLQDGKLFTGDLGYKDKDGYIFIVGRKKEIIKAGGNRVSVKEVEECLVGNDKVLEACVIGVPDPLLGEAIKAVIVLKPGAEMDAKEIIHHCRLKLADFKVPKLVSFVESLPKYQSGKINKQLLKQLPV